MSIHVPGATAKDSGIPTRDFHLAEYMYERLPETYRINDREQGQVIGEVKRLRPTVDDSEMLDVVRDEYQLLRFLRLFGSAINFSRTQTEATLTLQDVERCEAKWLPYLGKIIGWELNNELDVDTQRKELLSVIQLYQRKGREDAVGFLIDALTDFDYQFVEMKDRIFFTWGPPSDTTLNAGSHLWDPTEAVGAGTLEDKTYYLLGIGGPNGRPYIPTGITLFLYQDLLDSQYLLLTNKIQKVLQDFAPFNVVTVLVDIASYVEPPFISEEELKESGIVHHEDSTFDRVFALYTWTDPSHFGTESTGTLFDPALSLQYPLWSYLVKEESWTHAIV